MLTTKGQNLLACQQKAFAFRLSWDDFREHQDVDRLSKPPFIDDEVWEQVQETMSGYASIFSYIEDAGLDALACTDAQLKDVFDTIAKRRLCSPEDSWKHIRDALFGIGREHSWEDGERLELFGSPLVDTRNPASGLLPLDQEIPIKISFTITETTKASEKRKIGEEATSKPAKKPKEWDWIPENIEPGNFVVVLADKNNKQAMALPNIDTKVWVIEAKVYNKKTQNLVGTFYYNKELDIGHPLTETASCKIAIDERSVLAIYTVDIEEEFKLTAVNVREIEKYARMV